MNNVYTLLPAPRPAGEARVASIPEVVCKERATKPEGLWAAARKGAAAGGHLLRCRSSTMRAGIACDAPPRICPPGARAKVQTLFIDRPLEAAGSPLPRFHRFLRCSLFKSALASPSVVKDASAPSRAQRYCRKYC